MTSHPPKDLSHTEQVQFVSYAQAEDEIDLVDLWRLIMSKKHLLILGLLLAWLVAGAWLLLVKPEYEVKSRLLPPTPQMLAELSVIGTETKYSPLIVFKRYLNNFASVSNKKHFFENNNLVSHFTKEDKTPEEQDYIFTRKFSEKLDLVFDRKQAFPESAVAGFVLDDARLAAQWLDQYVDYIQQITLEDIFTDIERRHAVEKNNLKDQIIIKIAAGKQQREDKIAQLSEALTIARQLGIKTGDVYSLLSDGRKTAVEVNTQNQPLYTRGIEALSAELEALKARKSDEAFITGLRALEEKLAKLEMLKPDKNKTKTVIVDQQANIPEYAKNKKIPLILILSSFLGLFLGLFMIFIQHFLHRVRDAETSLNIESR
ncbi:MAG TPA: hypothetical protein EYP90_10780 [Chromatiaceae bacterium]|nr:hypothetical protein [Chromatiaceae bacterium]